LTLEALAHHNLANEVIVTRDGVEALDYLYRRGTFQTREEGNPAVVLIDAVKELGLFWGILNVPPPRKGAARNDNKIESVTGL